MSVTGVDTILKNLDMYNDSMMNKASMGMALAIGEAENMAKQSAPWKDRTGNARNSITGSGPVTKNDRIVTALAIGMFYGVYLELSNGGKFRVVWPTIEFVASKLPSYLK
jgi:hypothetical protein